MVKAHSDSEEGNPLPPHRLLFPINSKDSFICTIPTDRIANHSLCYTSHEHWLEREIAQWVQPMKDRSDDPSHHERTLLPRSYISLPVDVETAHLSCTSWTSLWRAGTRRTPASLCRAPTAGAHTPAPPSPCSEINKYIKKTHTTTNKPFIHQKHWLKLESLHKSQKENNISFVYILSNIVEGKPILYVFKFWVSIRKLNVHRGNI